tara:strand:- start:544 stop:1335 length:792 start_codon:yes stop_codon:yes gene_type:complete
MFKKLRSLIGRLFNENQQMIIVMYLSDFFWFLRKYFLSVEIKYPDEFLENWKKIRNNSSQDRERNFTVYQMIKVHNEIFNNTKTNIIEFGVDRGGTLTTISKFVKNDSEIFALDSFGFYANNIKTNVTNYDSHYLGKYKPFTKKTRFKNFDYLSLEKELNIILSKKNSRLDIIKCHFPDIIEKEYLDKINSKKYSFVHIDFDLYKPTIEVIKFIIPKLEKNAIILLDDYNFINQEGVKWAVKDSGINLNKCIQTQSGQLICYT